MRPFLQKKCILAAVIGMFFGVSRSSAFQDLPPTTYLGIEQGLSNNSVRCIYQDYKGFIWLGTDDGLNRYDGYGFKVFRNQFNDSQSLINNIAYAINSDDRNDLWIGTRQGLSVYDHSTCLFNPVYFVPLPGGARQKINNVVKDIKPDRAGNMLIGTEGLGLLICRKGSRMATAVPLSGKIPEGAKYGVQAIKVDARGRVWVLVQNIGLCRLDDDKMCLQLVNPSLPSSICLEADGDHLYTGTYTGLYSYDIASNTYSEVRKAEGGRLIPGMVVSITRVKNGDLWIGTDGGGVVIFDERTKKASRLPAGDGSNMLSSGGVFAIFEDKDLRKWIGTIRGGVNVLDPQRNRFHTITHDPASPGSLSGNSIHAFFETPDSNIWIGTESTGLCRWNRKKNLYTRFGHNDRDPASLSDNAVVSISTDKEKNIWIATHSSGIDRYNNRNGRFEHFKCINPVTGQENSIVFALYADREGNLWASTLHQSNVAGALYRWNSRAGKFEAFDPGLSDLFTLNEDNDGTLWGGNLSGLVRIDKINKRHIFYHLGYSVRTIYEDHYGNFWVGTEGGGLLLFDKMKGVIIARFTTDNGLCNNDVLTLLEDAGGNLWMSTHHGLSKFNITRSNFTNYYQSDGLQSNQFNFRAALRLRSGELIFGGIKGFSLFDPSGIRPASDTPSLVFTGLTIGNTPLEKAPSYLTTTDRGRKITIPYDRAVLTFDFTALEYTSPEKIAYSCYMEGWDRGWSPPGNSRTITYTSLKEGHYTFRVRCTNTEGAWNADEIAISIVVLPPWFRSWWAWLVYAIIACGIIYSFIRYRTRQTKMKYEIKIAHLEAERERAEHEKRLSLFTDLSHEFRTPLTLIINPVKQLLQSKGTPSPSQQEELGAVYRNARRILSLVDQLLLFRKAESGDDPLRPAIIDFGHLCREVYLCFVQQAKTKEMLYEFQEATTPLEILADREKVEIVLYNLLSNAFKFTPPGGKVLFRVEDADTEVKVEVADTGQGIPPEAGGRLFEKFYRAPNKGGRPESGFGIGLYLAKHFTEAHQGEISYTSEPGKGTTFTIRLPKGTPPLPQLPSLEAEPASGFLEELAWEEPQAPNRLPGDTVWKSKKSLLVVDDQPEMTNYIARLFEGNFTVYQAGSGKEGLAMARRHLPDIIIADIKMEEGSGIDLCKAIKTDPDTDHIPVILLTATSSTELRLEGVEGGADDYMTKPFENQLLIARVANLLKIRENLQKYFYGEITLTRNNLSISAEYKDFLDKCIAIVEKHMDNEQFNVKMLLAEMGMSRSNLLRKIKTVSGLSINVFIRFIRLRKAAELFIHSNYNVNETAFRVGINDAKYFREQFSKVFGMNPSEYIRKYRKNFSTDHPVNREFFTNP
ncbi:two-component regulator propeller domain-containing protein [Puia dinghuensis]|nr:two-component regulator propeller domain-containing protein [Puia dinghuensis]